MSRTKISILAKRSLIFDRVPRNFRNFCTTKSNKATKEDLETRRREVMGRGLPKQKPIEGVKQILIVASGKGGVGKSTTSVNLAVALKMNDPEKQVGLLDADVFGPSVPLMMNLDESPELNAKNMMEPLVNYGVKCMSMGLLVNKESAMIWRGLMVMSALDKLIRQVAWGPLDYLIVDTPPGTGDTHLSLVQNIPVDGVLLVTTPQKTALDVTRRGALMYKKLNVPLVGIVENMSSVICPKCNHEASLFRDGSLNLAWEMGINILCKIPINDDIAVGCDSGKPILVLKPNSRSSEIYKKLAKDVSQFLQEQRVNAT
ncbi:iron-sulfur protein NUBPL isoform X2 [Belonocnema kinseyi]|uniref:iron-sulfur protein NUBPL isoform X2 n=1 Tax=Belonocnema kinseyi TaxID=2817044 RepID=UPI00143D1594|nr:iron-sulfur protein NUBPL isoform X2 [Belonocnema kinseyi]